MQTLWSGELTYRALDQWTREIPINARRGNIVDTNGELLAGNETAYTVYARANAVKNAEECATTLSALLYLDREEVLKKLKDKSKSEIVLSRRVEKSVVEAIERTGLSGVYYARDYGRVYPYQNLACQLLGFTSVDQVGATGVEQYYNGYLAGKRGEILFETDLVGAEIEGTGASYLPAADGLNIKLTIDGRIQSLCEEVMKKAYVEHGAKATRCLVMDVNDFSLLAMVNCPSYDLNDVPRDNTALLNELTRNGLVSDIYEPGSTFKIVTAAANIQEYLNGNKSAFSNNYIFPSARTRTIEGSTVKCWSNHANGKHSNQTLAMALNNSCNPCFVDIAVSLGKQTFYDYLERFRFGKTTGIDFAGEASGMLLPELSLQTSDLARVGFGQSLAVTPLQLACATASAVNGGYYYTPHIVKEIYSEDGAVLERTERTLVCRTVSEEASQILSSMLEGVVSEGSGKKAYIEGYRIAGKTGTSQKFINGSLAQGKYVSSFIGYFPANKPRYLALVIVDEPQGSYYGSTVAGPCAGEIFQRIIDVMQIPPTEG